MPAEPGAAGVDPQRCPRAAFWARASGSMADPILFRLEGGLAWITLNRPEARNAINDEMRGALLDALARVAGDPAIRAAVLTGAGDGFCPGADLWGGRRDAAGPPPAGATRALMKQNSQRLIRAVLDLEKPMVAAVNGVAAGMGANLALARDVVVMAVEACLDKSYARRGPPGWRTARTCRRACAPSPSGGSRSSRDARPLAYTLLGGVRVLEVALLAPDLLGMHLADLGAEVVKIEQPPGGDYLREIGG